MKRVIIAALAMSASGGSWADEPVILRVSSPGANELMCVVMRTISVKEGASLKPESIDGMAITIEPGFELKGPIKLVLCDLKLTIGKP